jgi:hypothetical protein
MRRSGVCEFVHVEVRSCATQQTHAHHAAMMMSDLMNDDAYAVTVVVDQFHSAVGIHEESVTINL